ncbi:MAG: hypothetical protein P8H93_00810 [Polaribacter sp.]|nr:hypothetical protein [Polaribacter sp.]
MINSNIKNKNAFVVYVFGTYEKYIPSYIYFINKNYPDNDILVFSQGQISSYVKSSIHNLKNFHIYENIFVEHKDISGGGPRVLRYLLPRDYLKGYKYVYVGDVDILILKENESLFDFHKSQMEKINLPFSNKVRFLPNGGVSERLTGLHFFEVAPYYDKTEDLIFRILNDKVFSEEYLKKLERDEHTLFKLVKDCFNFDPLLLTKTARPWHGFHIGVVRGGKKLTKKQLNENSSISYDEIKSQLQDVLYEKDFVELFNSTFCIELYWSFKQFDLKLPFSFQLNYRFKKICEKVSKKLKKVFKF